MEANKNAPVYIKESITINSSPQEVWNTLTHIDQWSSWNPLIQNAKLNGELLPGTTFNWKTGGMKIKSTIHTAMPHERFGWTGKAIGSNAIHNWEIESKNGQVVVTMEESMDGWLVKMMRKKIQKELEKSALVWLEKLACKVISDEI